MSTDILLSVGACVLLIALIITFGYIGVALFSRFRNADWNRIIDRFL